MPTLVIPRRVLATALLVLLAVAAVLAIRYGMTGLHEHYLASIVGDPHHCQGGSPGPGCGN